VLNAKTHTGTGSCVFFLQTKQPEPVNILLVSTGTGAKIKSETNPQRVGIKKFIFEETVSEIRGNICNVESTGTGTGSKN
jgi:hypothetical protein